MKLKNINDIKTYTTNSNTYYYSYTKNKNDKNGNPRYTVYIIDIDNNAILEYKTGSYNINKDIKDFLDNL